MDLGLTVIRRSRGVGNRRQYTIVNFHQLCGIPRLGKGFSNYYRDVITDIMDFTLGQRRMRRSTMRLSVIAGDSDTTNQRSDTVGCQIIARQHRDYARSVFSCGGVDTIERCVRMR